MGKIICERQDLVNIANAIRTKNGKTEEFSIYQMPDEITSISGFQLPSLSNSGVSGDLTEGKQLIDADGNVVTGTFTIDSELTTQDNLISQIQSAVDNLPEAGGEPNLQTKTVTPTTSSQNVTPDSGFDGLSKVTVNGDANLKAENIAEGVSIFGVAGTHSGGSSGGGASVEMCTGEIVVDAPVGGNFTIWAVNENLQISTFTVNMMGGTFTAAKGTIVAIDTWSTGSAVAGGCTKCFGAHSGGAFIVTDNFTLIYTG